MKKINVLLLSLLILGTTMAQNMADRYQAISKIDKAECADNVNKTPIDGSKAMWDIVWVFDANGTNQKGIETDGINLYSASTNSGVFTRYDMDGGNPTEFTVAGADSIHDMAYDGTYFYGGHWGDLNIFVMDFTNETFIDTITVNCTGITSTRHIAFDPTLDSGNGGFWVGNLFQIGAIDMDGNELIANQGGNNMCMGSAYDDSDPENPVLWFYQQTGDVKVKLVEYDINTLSTTGFSWITRDVPGFLPTAWAGGLATWDDPVTGQKLLIGSMTQYVNVLFAYELSVGSSALNYDMQLMNLDIPAEVGIDEEFQIMGQVKNLGLEAVTSFDVSYAIDGGTPVVFAVSGVTISTGEIYVFTVDETVAFDTEGTYAIEVTIENINGNTDEDPSNNTLTHSIDVVVASGSWPVTPTGIIHTIQVPIAANPNIFGESLVAGDWIGVFYTNDDGVLACGGAAQKSPFGTFVVTAYGDDITTTEKDGFADGEVFKWKVYDVSENMEYYAIATYDATAPNQEFFATLGLSKITSLVATEYEQNYNFVSGWNSMSSYLTPEVADVETMFSPIVDNLTIFRNLTQVYWPGGNFNTIGDFDNQSGYVIHVDEALDFQLLGSGIADDVLALENAGWHFMPVLSECAVSIEDLFGDQISNVIIIQELIGLNMYWPGMSIYTLTELQPGKAYTIKISSAVSVEFPACGLKSGMFNTERISKVNTPWGILNLTPGVQTTVFLNAAMDDMQVGDVIGAFDSQNQLCGVATITNLTANTAINLGGNDQTNNAKVGFNEGEAVSFKLYRTATNEEFDVDVDYDQMLENTSGNYYQSTFAAVGNAWLKSSGIAAISNNSIQMYPNPAQNEVSISVQGNSTDLIKVIIFDINGRSVLEQEFVEQTTLNVSSIEGGVYFVKTFTNSDIIKVEKLIIR